MRDLQVLNSRIVGCRRCPRLVKYIANVARVKVRRYSEWEYWGRPLPGFGDPSAKLLIIGLAPAAHGGNRTGRMFTGDSSGNWLIRALHETGFANQPTSERRGDGLELRSAYVTAIVRCAPPDNKPRGQEIDNCSCYLAEELKILKDVRVVLTLGSIAFNGYTSLLQMKGLKFAHGASYKLPSDSDKTLIASYHPSRQNTQTGRLTWRAWIGVFRKIRKMIDYDCD
ncbi:MAG: uracil-DNA glycosylase [Nitrososphaerales archaeon]